VALARLEGFGGWLARVATRRGRRLSHGQWAGPEGRSDHGQISGDSLAVLHAQGHAQPVVRYGDLIRNNHQAHILSSFVFKNINYHNNNLLILLFSFCNFPSLFLEGTSNGALHLGT
jgi:hypothetical protein